MPGREQSRTRAGPPNIGDPAVLRTGLAGSLAPGQRRGTRHVGGTRRGWDEQKTPDRRGRGRPGRYPAGRVDTDPGDGRRRRDGHADLAAAPAPAGAPGPPPEDPPRSPTPTPAPSRRTR